MGSYDWPSSRGRAPTFPWDAAPRAPARRGAPDLSNDDDAVAVTAASKPAALALVPVQLGVGAFRAPIPRVQFANVAPSGGLGFGGERWGTAAPACCGEASAGGSRLTARSIFGFPSASVTASVSVSQSCAAFGAGDDGAEVDSGAAHAAAHAAAVEPAAPTQQPLLQRAPAGFFAQLGPPPGLEMYYGGPAAARQEQSAVDAAALVPYAASRKRPAPDDWMPQEQPARVFRGGYDSAAMEHMDAAFDQPGDFTATVVTHEEVVVDTAPDWSYLAHLSAAERQMLPACAATAHDPREPYDAELQPMRRDHENEE